MIEIIGGGLAGLSAAVGLARRGVAVRVYEKKQYPCVKLCGEFLSPEGLAALSRLTERREQVLEAELGLRLVQRFAWVSRRGQRLRLDLNPGGWAVRRDVLDPWLAEVARKAGAQLHFGESREPAPERRQLRATGKEHQGLKNRYFAVKGYCAEQNAAEDVLGGLDIVLYQLEGGYIGFTRMAGQELSYCALLDKNRCAKELRFTNWAQLCDGIFKSNRELSTWAPRVRSLLDTHVGAARFDFETRDAVREGIWFAGDAVQLVPPFVGDGMAMAIEGGELAAQALAEGMSDLQYIAAWRRKFLPRVRTAKVLHPFMWLGAAHEPVLGVLNCLPRFTHWIYAQTRGRA